MESPQNAFPHLVEIVNLSSDKAIRIAKGHIFWRHLRLLSTWRFLCVGNVQRAKFKELIYYHHGSCGPSLTGKTSLVSLIFTHGTHRNVKNRWMRSSLYRHQNYSLSPGVWQSFVTIRSCNHLMRIISTYVDNTKKSEISWRWQLFKLGDNQLWGV